MAQLTTSNTAEFKHVYSNDILDYVVEKYAKFVKWLDKTDLKPSDIGDGFYWEVPLQSGWNTTVSSEGGAFGTDTANSSVQPYVTLGQLTGKIAYSLLLKQVGRGRGAFVDSVKRQMSDCLNDTVSLADRYFSGCSGDGILATVQDSTSTSTSFVCSLPMGDKLLEQGMKIQIHDGTSTEREDYTRITKIVRSTRTVTVSDSQNLTGGDYVYISGGASLGTQGLSTHVNGLGNLVSDSGTVHNLLRSTYENWKAVVLSNGGSLRNLSEDVLLDAFMQVETDTKANSGIDTLLMNKGQLFKYYQHVRPDRRFSVTGGSVPDYNTGANLKPTFLYGERAVPIEVFSHIKPRTVYGVVKSNLARIGDARPKWQDGPELGISSNSRTTSEEMFLVWFIQFISKKMNNAFRIDDLSDPVLAGARVGGSDS